MSAQNEPKQQNDILLAKSQDLQNNNHTNTNTTTIDEATSKVNKLTITPTENICLFDSSLLAELNPSDFLFQYAKFETVSDSKTGAHFIELGNSLILRPLRRNDFDFGYMTLMSQLTQCGQVTATDFQRRFDQMKACAGTYYTCVVEDTQSSKIIASTTLVYEQKFIRGTAARGRIEDVVVDVEYRGKRLSKILLDVLTKMSEKLGCYKVSLECKDQLKGHYEAFGFKLEAEQNYLCRRFV